MFKSFVLGLYASGHSLHVQVTQTFAVNNVCLPVSTTKVLQKRGTVFCSVPLLSVPFGFFHIFSFCLVQSMSMQYFSQRYFTATGGSILVEGDTPICRSSSWSESNHRRKVGSDTPAACANSDLSFDLYAIFCLFCCFRCHVLALSVREKVSSISRDSIRGQNKQMAALSPYVSTTKKETKHCASAPPLGEKIEMLFISHVRPARYIPCHPDGGCRGCRYAGSSRLPERSDE